MSLKTDAQGQLAPSSASSSSSSLHTHPAPRSCSPPLPPPSAFLPSRGLCFPTVFSLLLLSSAILILILPCFLFFLPLPRFLSLSSVPYPSHPPPQRLFLRVSFVASSSFRMVRLLVVIPGLPLCSFSSSSPSLTPLLCFLRFLQVLLLLLLPLFSLLRSLALPFGSSSVCFEVRGFDRIR